MLKRVFKMIPPVARNAAQPENVKMAATRARNVKCLKPLAVPVAFKLRFLSVPLPENLYIAAIASKLTDNYCLINRPDKFRPVFILHAANNTENVVLLSCCNIFAGLVKTNINIIIC
jgi:hypothetical protein